MVSGGRREAGQGAIVKHPWAEIEARCHRQVGEFVTDAGFEAARRRRHAGQQPTDVDVLGAKVDALTYLVGEVMAEAAKLQAKADRGLWERVKAWWRS